MEMMKRLILFLGMLTIVPSIVLSYTYEIPIGGGGGGPGAVPGPLTFTLTNWEVTYHYAAPPYGARTGLAGYEYQYGGENVHLRAVISSTGGGPVLDTLQVRAVITCPLQTYNQTLMHTSGPGSNPAVFESDWVIPSLPETGNCPITLEIFDSATSSWVLLDNLASYPAMNDVLVNPSVTLFWTPFNFGAVSPGSIQAATPSPTPYTFQSDIDREGQGVIGDLSTSWPEFWASSTAAPNTTWVTPRGISNTIPAGSFGFKTNVVDNVTYLTQTGSLGNSVGNALIKSNFSITGVYPGPGSNSINIYWYVEYPGSLSVIYWYYPGDIDAGCGLNNICLNYDIY